MTVKTPITPGQLKQIVRFFEDGLKALNLSKEVAQRVITQGGVLQERVGAVIKELAQSEQYASEEVPSDYNYPREYAIKPLEEQIATLKQRFPQLRIASAIAFVEEALPELALPDGAEGWFAIPRWDKIAHTYGEAVEKMLVAVASTRKLTNFRKRQLGPTGLRQNEDVAEAWNELAKTQHGDILIVPAQFGKRHRGRSIRRARAVFSSNEFGLGAFACGAMLLTHPERLVRWVQLHIDCAGDEYAPDADGAFSFAPVFDCHDGGVRFDTNWAGFASARYGTASAFLPQ